MRSYMMYQLLSVVTMSVFEVNGVFGDCLGPQMKLLSDDPRRTCTEIFASKNTIEYSCTSLIKGFRKAMIRYCPVEVCMKNGTWSKPSISCAESECYEAGKSEQYAGHRMCTRSGRHCQRWDIQEPHRHGFKQDVMFPSDYSIQLAEAFCRDPEGSKGAPWCFTTDPKKKWEFCDIKKCSDIIQLDGFCGQKQQEKVDTTSAEQVDTTPAEQDVEDNASIEFGKNDKSSLEKIDDGKERYAGSLKFCSSGLQFEIENDHRLRGKVLLENRKRSVVECASHCSMLPFCRSFTFRRADGTCTLHGGKEYTVIKSLGFRAGIKSCHL